MTTTAPPTAGLARHLAFLAQHAGTLAEHDEHITMASATRHKVYLTVDSEGTAVDLAIALGVTAPPVYATTPGYDHFTRESTVHGVPVYLATLLPVAQAAA